jgi:hypothetical protein
MDFINFFLLIAILMGLYTYYEGMEFSSLTIYLSFFALIILYFGGKQYLRESFVGNGGNASNLENPAGSADFGPERVQNSEANVVTRSREIKLGTVSGDVDDDRALYVDEATGNIADKPFETPVNMREIAKPFAQTPINSLAEYDDPSSDGMLLTDLNSDNTEIDAISNNEGERGGKQESKYIKNQRMFDRKFEWSSNLPPSSIVQQIQQSKWNATLNETAAQFKGSGSAPVVAGSEGFQSKGRTEGFLGEINGGAAGQVMKTGDVYEDIDGSNLQPVDTTKLEQEERAILNTFEFKRSASDIGSYNPDDVAELLDKYYSKQGKTAYYVKRDDGAYEVFETEEKKAKVVYEEEEPDVAREELGDDMTDTITVPKGVAQYSSKLDPFFEPRQAMRANRQDYTAFTPGLERMFAPTEPTQQWY